MRVGAIAVVIALSVVTPICASASSFTLERCRTWLLFKHPFLADWDRDGRFDLLATVDKGKVLVWAADWAGTFSPQFVLAVKESSDGSRELFIESSQ